MTIMTATIGALAVANITLFGILNAGVKFTILIAELFATLNYTHAFSFSSAMAIAIYA